LSTRLSELVQSRLIARTDDRAYVLTDLGGEVCRAIAPLDAWSRRWAAELASATVSQVAGIPSTTRESPG
jgi:DNA-binding HxlR family transcriptional regulator